MRRAMRTFRRAGAAFAFALLWIATPAHAALAQGGGGGGGRVEQLGERTADLFSEILGPVIIVLVAVVGLVAYAKREVGIAVTAAAIAIFLGLFVFAPETAESLIRGFWERIA